MLEDADVFRGIAVDGDEVSPTALLQRPDKIFRPSKSEALMVAV